MIKKFKAIILALAAFAQASALPTFVDNSKTIFFPPIINQKGGSCAQASGIGYMFTYEMNRLLNRNASESAANRFAYLYTWNFVNGGGDNGGFVDEGLIIAKNFGVMSEEDFGYAAVYQFKWASGYDKYYRAAHYRVKSISKFDDTTDEGIQKIKEYLYNHGDGSKTGGVLTFSTQASNWKIDGSYKGPSLTGYHSILTRLATEGGHAITIAGYDDTVESTDEQGNPHKGAFIVVNTWGSYWEDNGRFYLPYYFFTRSDRGQELNLSSTMQGCNVYYSEPKVMFKIKVDYSSRNDLRLTYGTAYEPYALSSPNNYNSIIVSSQGGDHAMTGAFDRTGSGIFEFGVDYTDHMTSSDAQYGRYFLNIVRSQRGKKIGEGTIESFSVIDYRGGAPKEYVCRGIAGRKLNFGRNDFSVRASHPGHFSASPVSHIDRRGDVKTDKFFVVKTAYGHYAKVKFSGTRSGLNMKYTMLK